MVVERGEDARGHQAKPGDVIKLGRVMFKIKQVTLPFLISNQTSSKLGKKLKLPHHTKSLYWIRSGNIW